MYSPARGPLCGDVMVPVWSTPPNRVSSGVFVGTCWLCPWCPRLPVPTAGLLLGVWVCCTGPRCWKRPLSEPEPMVPSRLMDRCPGSFGLLLPAPMSRPGTRGKDECTACFNNYKYELLLTKIFFYCITYWVELPFKHNATLVSGPIELELNLSAVLWVTILFYSLHLPAQLSQTHNWTYLDLARLDIKSA